MKNVMLITQSLKGGGAEKVVANLSIALSKYCNVIIVSYRKDEDEFIHAGTRIDLNIPGGIGSPFKKIRNAIKRIEKIRKLKIEYDIDYSISFVPQTDYANVFTNTKKCHNIIEISSNSLAAFETKINRVLRMKILNKADLIVTVSEGSRLQVIKEFKLEPEKVKTIYNPIDIARIKELAAQTIISNKLLPSKYIIAIGSFRKPKGHWHLIKSFATIMDSIPEHSLVILGEGEYREKYEALVRSLNIPRDRIYMPGYISNPYAVISKADLLVFSSIYEGFGNVIVEAMSCGVPVISSDCDFGPREILEPESPVTKKAEYIEYGTYGCLVKPFSMEDISMSTTISDAESILAEGIRTLLNDPVKMREYRIQGLRRCKEFDLDSSLSNWIKLMNLNE